MKKLMLGSGNAPGNGPEWINVDVVDFGNNVVHDLSRFPWPFAADEFDAVVATDILEHIIDAVGFINEMIRVGKPGCAYRVQVPNAAFPVAVWTDPEHIRGFSERSFDYWQRGTNLCNRYGASKNKGGFFIEGLVVRPLNNNLVFTFRKAAP
jgi:predicted SAM-dependent methyltransferase